MGGACSLSAHWACSNHSSVTGLDCMPQYYCMYEMFLGLPTTQFWNAKYCMKPHSGKAQEQGTSQVLADFIMTAY